MPTFTKIFDSVSTPKIAAVEKNLGVTFPTDYKQFLKTTNGGIPEPNCFSVPARGDALCDLLYGISDGKKPSDLERAQERVSQWEPLPRGFIAIGHDPGGSALLLSTSGKDAGTVFFWDRNGLWVRKDGHNTFPIAKTFTAFVDGLHEMPTETEAVVHQ